MRRLIYRIYAIYKANEIEINHDIHLANNRLARNHITRNVFVHCSFKADLTSYIHVPLYFFNIIYISMQRNAMIGVICINIAELLHVGTGSNLKFQNENICRCRKSSQRHFVFKPGVLDYSTTLTVVGICFNGYFFMFRNHVTCLFSYKMYI